MAGFSYNSNQGEVSWKATLEKEWLLTFEAVSPVRIHCQISDIRYFQK
jgi:hypothetical protein